MVISHSKQHHAVNPEQATDTPQVDKVHSIHSLESKRMDNGRPESDGLHRDLEALLIAQIKARPADCLLRARLLELYFSDQRKDAYLREAGAYNKACKRSQDPETWDMVVQMGKRLLPDEQLFITMGEGIEFDFDTGSQEVERQRERVGENPRYAPYFEELIEASDKLRDHSGFMIQLENELRHISNRPTPMMHARRLSLELGGAQIYIKREDLAASATQLTIAVVGQALMAQRLGLKKLVTASANGFRGVITASVARRLGLQALVFVDSRARDEQPGNLQRMSLLGAEVEAVDMDASRNGDDIREVALDYCLHHTRSAFMVSGLDALPAPYPAMQMEFQSVIGRECMRQVFADLKRLPDLIVARAGDNPDAIGSFAPFLKRAKTRLACVPMIETLAEQVETDESSRNLAMHSIHHIRRTEGRLRAMSRILEGLEYPSVRREHAWLKASGRVEYPEVSESQVKKAIRDFSDMEGFIPGVATAHALAWACQQAANMPNSQAVVVVTSEKTELDIAPVAELAGLKV